MRSKQELQARGLIESIAEEVRTAATDARLQRVTHRLLGSFPPDHVITELIQNADDVGATNATVVLMDKGVIFVHNGEDFNEADLRALCDIGITTKKPGVHIGFMGIGFKAVFKITNSPCVFSGPYRFYFTREDVFVPHWLDKVAEDLVKFVKQGYTTFFLPFRPDLTSEMIDSLRENIFTKLESVCMVFLNNIEEVTMVSEGFKSTLTKKSEILGSAQIISEKITITEKEEDKKKEYSYIVLKKTLEIPEPVKRDYRAIESRRSELKTTDIILAFSLSDDEFLKPAGESVLYTFLPTPFETGLRFTINGDFLLNTQRTEPDFTSQWNIWLLESIGDALKEIVSQFVDNAKQKNCFYDVLPRRKEVPEKLFSKIGIPLIEHMQNIPSVVTSDGKLAKPSETVLVSEQVQLIMPPTRAGVQHYVHPSVKGKVFVREELGVKDLSEGSEERKYVLSALEDREWMDSLKAKQIRAIYDFLYSKMYGDYEERWRIYYHEHTKIEERLKKLKLVRATNGRFYKAEETLLPSRSGKQIKTVDLPCLVFVDPATLSVTSLKFLKEIGAKDISEESIVGRILDSHRRREWRNWTEDDVKRSMKFIANWIKSKNYQVGQMEPKLENVILPIGDRGWASAFTCYEVSPFLKMILPTAKFVDLSRTIELVKEPERFLEVVGVSKIPRVVSKGSVERWEEAGGISRERWRDYWHWLSKEDYTEYSTRTESVSESFHLDGFDDCVLKQNMKGLMKYLDFLVENWNTYYNNFTSCRYHYFYYSAYRKDVPSYFAYQLKTSNWLPTSKGLKHVDGVFAPLRELKRIGGKFLNYLTISEEQAKKGKEFLQFLGIKTETDLQILLTILDRLKHEGVTADLKKQLGRIYKKMAILLGDEEIEQGALKEVFVLNKDGDFELSTKLYWIDEPGVESVFGREIPTVWVPDGLSTPHAESLFNALGITKISSILQRKRIDDGEEAIEDGGLTDQLRRRSDHLYSVLQHHKANRVEEFPDFIKKVVVVKVKQLRLKIKVLDVEHKIEVPCFCSKEEKRIYVSSETKLSDIDTEISRELARVFGARPGSEFTLGFVLAMQNIDSVNEQLKRSSIRLTSLPEPEIEEIVEEFKQLEGVLEGGGAVTEPSVQKPEEPPIVTPTETPTQAPSEAEMPPQVNIDFNSKEVEKEVEEAKHLLTTDVVQKDTIDVWTEPKEIEEVVSPPRVIVRPFVSTSTGKNWKSRVLDGEKVFVESGINTATIRAVRTSIKAFKERMCKIVEVMGGNPEIVNICIAKPETDGDRRKGQLFFNVARKDSPLRWLVVAAREIAYIKIPKLSYAHISLMTDLIERALQRIDEIYPDFFRKTNARSQKRTR